MSRRWGAGEGEGESRGGGEVSACVLGERFVCDSVCVGVWVCGWVWVLGCDRDCLGEWVSTRNVLCLTIKHRARLVQPCAIVTAWACGGRRGGEGAIARACRCGWCDCSDLRVIPCVGVWVWVWVWVV